MSVVVGYVPTAEGEVALEHAIREAGLREQRLVVVNSSRGDAPVDLRYALPDEVEVLSKRIEAAGVDHLVAQSMRGRDAADEMIEAANRHRADLLVIGVRRRTPVGKLVLGSTAQRILLEAPCPVLAVKVPLTTAG